MSYLVFEEKALEYDAWFDENRVIYENELKLLKMFFPCKRPCLEVGVGTGRFATPLGVDVGLDPSFTALSMAVKRGVMGVLGFGEEMPFRDRYFSTVYLIVTLCFLENPERVLVEVNRVLEDHGKLVTCIIPLDSPWGKFYAEKKEKGVSEFYKYATFYTRNEVKQMLRRTGFRVTRAGCTLRYPPTSRPIPEEPMEGEEGSFVCYEAVKTSV